MFGKVLIAIAIVAMPHLVKAQSVTVDDATVSKIIEIASKDNQVMNHLDILTGRFGGRLIGSGAYDDAAAWMIDQYRRWGVQARLEEAGELPVGFNRGPWWGRLHAGGDGIELHFATPSYTSGTHGVQRGHVMSEPKSQADFDRNKHKLKGAWVLLDGNRGGFALDKTAKGDSVRAVIKAKNDSISKENTRLGNEAWENGTYNDFKPTPLEKAPGLFYKEMVDAGVLGFVMSASLPIRALYDRALVNDSTTNFYNLPTQPEILLDEHQFSKIEQMVKDKRDIQLEFDIRNHFRLGPVKYHSVVAEIPGTEFPDEYVIISGHLDAFDVATGAVDCGTGIGPMMEAARLLAAAGAKPKRTIRFVAFAGEEFGLLGAQAYVKAHENELPRISMLFNRDGGPTPAVGMRVPQAMVDDIKEASKYVPMINKDYPWEVAVAEPRVKPTSTGGTDASVFALHGVPTYGFFDRDFKGYGFEYGEIWHTENDILNKEIPEYQEHTAVVTAVVALGVANLDHLLSREGMYKDAEKEPLKEKKNKKKDKRKK